MEPLRLCFRLDAEVALERVAAELILPQCMRAVARSGVVAHESAMRLLVRGLKLEQPLCRSDGGLAGLRGHQLAESIDGHVMQARALDQQPIAELGIGKADAIEQVAAVKRDCL